MEINPFFSIVEEVEPEPSLALENEQENEQEVAEENAQPVKVVKAHPQKTQPNTVVSQARQNARQIKILEEQERRERVAQLKEQRRLEKERKLQEAEKNKKKRREDLEERSQRIAQIRKRNLEVQRTHEQSKKEAERLEIRQRHQDHVQLRKDREEEEKQRREHEAELIRREEQERRELEQQRLQEQRQKQEQDAMFKQQDHFDTSHYKQMQNARKRQSMAGRWHQFRTQRQRLLKVQQQQQAHEASLLESRREGFQDMHSYKESQKRRARESMAGRLDHWRNEERVAEQQSRDQQLQEKVDQATVRAQFSQDDRAAKEEERRRARESMAGRLDHWRNEERVAEQQSRDQQLQEKVDQATVRAQFSQDDRAAKEEERRRARESLAMRGEAWRDGKEWEEGDADRKFWEQQDALAVRAEFADDDRYHREQLAYEEWKDRELQSEIDRMAKLHEEGMTSQRILEEQDVFEIRREFTLDDKEEARKQRELRKQSLAMRLEAWREGKEVDRQDRDFQNVQKEEDEILKEMDREAVREAKQQQQASEIEDILTSAFLV